MSGLRDFLLFLKGYKSILIKEDDNFGRNLKVQHSIIKIANFTHSMGKLEMKDLIMAQLSLLFTLKAKMDYFSSIECGSNTYSLPGKEMVWNELCVFKSHPSHFQTSVS